MPEPDDLLGELRALNAMASFDRWAGIEVVAAKPGEVELRMAWRADIGHHAEYLHAGLIGALIDTVCGFAAATATHPSPAGLAFLGQLPVARRRGRAPAPRAHRLGRAQADLHHCGTVRREGWASKLVATGEAILEPVDL